MKKRFLAWLYGDQDVMDGILDNFNKPDVSHSELKKITRAAEEEYDHRPEVLEAIGRDRARFRTIYLVIAFISCIMLTLVLLYTVSLLPEYGAENPRAVEVVSRYVEDGLEETGAVNIVSGMIPLICVMILLRIDSKNQRSDYEDYYTVRTDTYFDLSSDPVLRLVCAVIVPCILLYGIYILLNGQNSPGGGFSGGAVLGAGMILFSVAFGFDKADRFFTLKVSNIVTFVSLGFYSFAKGYVFFMGANGLENHIPKGTPGAIFSGGMILPLDIAVGCVVGCTMFGFYSLFRRGSIGGQI